MSTRDLLGDGSLGLRVSPQLVPVAEEWLYPLPPPTGAAGGALIDFAESPLPLFAPPSGPPLIHATRIRGWMVEGGAVLASPDGRVGATIAADRSHARVQLLAGEARTVDGRVGAREALTVAAGLLLARQHRVLLHGAAVLAPGGGAWLLAGESHSGKTTTCANLIRAGFEYLADDQVVVSAGGGGALHATGWPRRFMLDRGFAAGESLGERFPTDPALLGPGRRRPVAPLAGVLFPRVERGRPTRVEGASAAECLTRLLPNSPWLTADPLAARPLMAVLAAIACLPARRLRLGCDTLGDPARLAAILAPAFSRTVQPRSGTGSSSVRNCEVA